MAHWNTLVSAAKALLTIALVLAITVLTATLTSALVSFSKELATVVVVTGFVTAMGLAVFAFGEV
jgi:hypothetical protein